MLHVASVCSPCYLLLRVVGNCCTKFETGQAFELTSPNISFVPWSPKRSATMLDPRVCTDLPTLLARATHAHYTWYPSSLQCLMGCILPTMHCRSQHCWEWLHPFAHNCQHGRSNSQHCWANNVGSSLRPLHVLSIRLYAFLLAENIETHLGYKTLSTKIFRNFSLSLLHSRF